MKKILLAGLIFVLSTTTGHLIFAQEKNNITSINQDIININSQTTTPSENQDSFVNIFSTEGSFDDVKEDLLSSIADSGLVISYTSHARSMLENTAAVAGITTPIYNEAEVILFCKADLSHKLVQANPHNLVLCPYAISIYVIHKEPNRVYLSFREPPKNIPETKAIKQLLIDIIEEVL